MFIQTISKIMSFHQLCCIELLVKILVGFSEKMHIKYYFESFCRESFESKYK